MKKNFIALSGIVLAGTLASTAIGESHADKSHLQAVKARQSQMTLYSFNLGVLGDMAKGATEYDADVASKAASNLAALSSLDQSRLWPMGSDNSELGTDVTEALPKIWAADSDIGTMGKALADSTAALSGVAGDGLDALRGAIGGVGKACGDCHKAYRQPDS